MKYERFSTARSQFLVQGRQLIEPKTNFFQKTHTEKKKQLDSQKCLIELADIRNHRRPFGSVSSSVFELEPNLITITGRKTEKLRPTLTGASPGQRLDGRNSTFRLSPARNAIFALRSSAAPPPLRRKKGEKEELSTAINKIKETIR